MRHSALGLALRAVAFSVLWLAVAWVPAWQRPNALAPAPQGFGVALGYGLGGVRELDALGQVWYLDYNYRGPALGKHPRFLSVPMRDDLGELRTAARANRGAWWQFGNEPNDPNQDNVSPAEYARAYHAFYYALKAADSAARVVPAGIADVDWEWAASFRDAYRAQFGRFPPVDGWNIHNYLLDTCEGALDVELFKARVLAFRTWMTSSGEGEKPLFLTEYGVLYGNGCCDCPSIPAPRVLSFMRATSEWLQTSHAVTAWAWFAVNTHHQFNGDLFEEGSQLTLFGQGYRDLIAQDSNARFK